MLKRILKNCLDGLLFSRTLKNKNSILLTFDDGPDPDLTLPVLDLLDQHQAKAVFFVVGRRVKNEPALLRTIVDRGHVVANHSYNHEIENMPSFFLFRKDLQANQKIIQDTCGQRPQLFRPPGGKLTLSSLLVPSTLGLKTMLWSVSGNDWKVETQEEALQIAASFKQKIQGGDIILLHDFRQNVLVILEELLPYLIEQGYDLSEVVTDM